MPTSVFDLLNSCGLQSRGPVRWGKVVPDELPGCYVISMSNSPMDRVSSHKSHAPISLEILGTWIDRVPGLLLESTRPTPAKLRERLARFWLPDETILYIGKAATSVKKRVSQYYRTPLGDRAPHHGGHWIKTLLILPDLNVFWAVSDKPEEHESIMLRVFAEAVSESTRKRLDDPSILLPFANIKGPDGVNKKHGISNPALRD